MPNCIKTRNLILRLECGSSLNTIWQPITKIFMFYLPLSFLAQINLNIQTPTCFNHFTTFTPFNKKIMVLGSTYGTLLKTKSSCPVSFTFWQRQMHWDLLKLMGMCVGHHGAQGCQIGCPMKGRHKPSIRHYYAVYLQPFGINTADCSHPDFDFQKAAEIEHESVETYQVNITQVICSWDQNNYECNQKLIGLSKPSIIQGLTYTIPVPMCFSLDPMHIFINLSKLFIPLWRGTLKCEETDYILTWDWATLTGDVWQQHGKLVADATLYFPSSFHCPPRNPAEKISSGYKATEYVH